VDDSSFDLSEHLRVLYRSGIRSVLVSEPDPPMDALIWEPPWSNFISKLPVTAQSIWAYPDLFYDLTGKASQERGFLWRTMIRFMNLPKGFVGFFPYTLPVGNKFVTHMDQFSKVIFSYSPTSIIIFGDDCFAEKFLSFLKSTSFNLSTLRLIVAPSPEELRKLSEDSLNKYSRELLSSVLSEIRFPLS